MGTALETIPYSYGDANWKDKLTAYNGTTITYDAIGNPLNDGAWNYTWTAGRQLAQMDGENLSISYKYNYRGMRIQKSVTTTEKTEVTNYTMCGSKITAMTKGADYLHFYYDDTNKPVSVLPNCFSSGKNGCR